MRFEKENELSVGYLNKAIVAPQLQIYTRACLQE